MRNTTRTTYARVLHDGAVMSLQPSTCCTRTNRAYVRLAREGTNMYRAAMSRRSNSAYRRIRVFGAVTTQVKKRAICLAYNDTFQAA